jgi:hypothetical protein
VLTDAEPAVAFPVENPPPVQLVALVEDQLRVEGTPFVGLAEKLQVAAGGGIAATVMLAQLPQLFPSLVSVTVPFQALSRSTQVR